MFLMKKGDDYQRNALGCMAIFKEHYNADFKLVTGLEGFIVHIL